MVLCVADKVCRWMYEGPVGVILSPRYPAVYPSSTECQYFIHVALSSVIQLRPTEFALRNMDMLQVY